MNKFSYIFLLIINSFTLIRAEKAYLYLSDCKVKFMEYNQSKIKFCNSVENENCVKSIRIVLNSIATYFNSSDDVKTLNLETNGKIKINVEINLRLNGSDFVSNMEDSQLININTTVITLKNLSISFIAELSLVAKCQNEYLLPKCAEIDLCKKIPQGVCRNNGICYQDNGAVKCKCNLTYKGEFCDTSVDPCEGHFCANNSTCQADPSKISKYRCDCKQGYEGKFCNEVKNPCKDNSCMSNSTCMIDDKILEYSCICREGFAGRHCESNVDYCSRNQTLCSHFVNATCFNIKDSPICYCEGGCQTEVIPSKFILSFKSPFWELITIVFVFIEGVFILILIIVIIIIKTSCFQKEGNQRKSYYDDNLLLTNGNKTENECLEFGSNYNRQPIVLEDLDNRKSINPLYDINDLQSFTKNHITIDTPGMSTFGRR